MPTKASIPAPSALGVGMSSRNEFRASDAFSLADEIIAYITENHLDREQAEAFNEEIGNTVDQHIQNYVAEGSGA